jgi:hypothetical protein
MSSQCQVEGALTKRDVARRQLATAIRLFFDAGDLVSTFSLAANAWEIVDILCERQCVVSISRQTREHLPAGKDLKYDYINSPYRNFFKHADRDPEATLVEFRTGNVDAIIFLGVEDYLRLFEKAPVEFQVYQLWYLATNSEKVASGHLASVLERTDDAFPGIRDLPRAEQLALGRKVLCEAMANAEVRADPQTEEAW